MSRLFADTSYYAALLSERDQNHAQAVALSEAFHGQAITTDFVLVEAGNLLCRSADRSIFLRLLDTLGNDPQTTVIPATRGLFDLGCSLFASRMDKDWSLTDCVSFVVMQQQGLSEALTADHHFEQAGVVVLLR